VPGVNRAIFHPLPAARAWIAAMLALAACLAQSPAAMAQDDGAIELYKARLLQTGSRLRAYPAEAYTQKLSGTVLLTVSISAKGQLARNQLAKSSGHRILDEHALALIEKAVPVTELPPGLRDLAFTIQVAVVFALPPTQDKLGFNAR
jgi:TonB family protein